MKLEEMYDEIAQDETIEREKAEFDRALANFLNSAKDLGLSKQKVMMIVNQMMGRWTGLGEALGQRTPTDAAQIAKALVLIARDKIPDPKMQLGAALQMADNLHKRIRSAIEEYEKESTWM